MNPATDYLVIAGVAFAAVLIATPLVGWLARRVGAVAEPGGRHIHTVPTPTLGGLALFAGVLAAIAAASRLGRFEEVFRTTTEPEAIVLASLVVVALGVADDVRGISAPAKVAGQILASGTLVLFGIALRYVYLPGGAGGEVLSLTPDLSAVLTIVGIVAMMNAVNLVDGLDGLAAGIVTIAAAALFVYTALAENAGQAPSSAPLVLAALVGACLGFLVHNFNPATIFMGDTGAMLLGLLLGSAGVSAVGSTIQPTGGTFAAVSIPVLVPVLVLAVPFLDTIWTIIRRLLSGRAVFSPDKQHLHHRLLEIGHSHRRAVLIMYYWSGLLAFVAVGVSLLSRQVLATVVGSGIGLALTVMVAGRLTRRYRLLKAR
jgi:UDP-GlcNAc:undecaprenyl-phosphate GlcNAc-1-phosphate transferase